MKTISLGVLVSFLVLSGLALAAQQGEQKDQSSTMQQMMKDGEKRGQQNRMMRMMKMMDQCSAMMESAHDSERAKDNEKK